MGHTLFLWSVSVLAGQAVDGQMAEYPATKPCASCQAAQQQQQQQQMQDPSYSPARGPLGLGIWDRLRHRSDEPGVFSRVQMRVSGWFSSPQQQQQPHAELGAPVAESFASPGNGGPIIRNVTTEPPLNGPAAVPANFQSSPSIPPPDGASSINPTSSRSSSPVIRVSASTNDVSQPDGNTIQQKFVDKCGHESDYSWVTGQLNFLNNEWMIEYAIPGTVDQFAGKLVLVNVDPSNLQIGDLVCVSGAVDVRQRPGDWSLSCHHHPPDRTGQVIHPKKTSSCSIPRPTAPLSRGLFFGTAPEEEED